MKWVQDIEDAICSILKASMPDISRFTDEIKQSDEKQFYVDVYNPSVNMVNAYHQENSINIDIGYLDKHHLKENYYLMAEKLDGIFRPVFYFKNRAITVQNASFIVVDNILHFKFLIVYTDSLDEKTEDFMKTITLIRR